MTITKTVLTKTSSAKLPLRLSSQVGAIALAALLASPLAWAPDDYHNKRR